MVDEDGDGGRRRWRRMMTRTAVDDDEDGDGGRRWRKFRGN